MSKRLNVRVPVHRGKAHLIVPRGTRVETIVPPLVFTGGEVASIRVGRASNAELFSQDDATIRIDRVSSAYQAPAEAFSVVLALK